MPSAGRCPTRSARRRRGDSGGRRRLGARGRWGGNCSGLSGRSREAAGLLLSASAACLSSPRRRTLRGRLRRRHRCGRLHRWRALPAEVGEGPLHGLPGQPLAVHLEEAAAAEQHGPPLLPPRHGEQHALGGKHPMQLPDRSTRGPVRSVVLRLAQHGVERELLEHEVERAGVQPAQVRHVHLQPRHPTAHGVRLALQTLVSSLGCQLLPALSHDAHDHLAEVDVAYIAEAILPETLSHATAAATHV
mmetsp:Transcript_16495/g.39126  ORF Transcript_16495/g.39126 Transcript_16495/m.39126 type:complete len:247 (+) Transcript_16495:359-1099(+)